MKKIIILLVAIVLILAGCAGDSEKPATQSINVYNWGIYISDGTDGYIDVNAEFTKKTGIQVNYTTFETNESLYTKLKTGGANYDVIFPSDYMVSKLIDEDMLAPLNYDNIPNYSHIDEEFKGRSYDPEDRYTVPYTWGAVGLIYNSKYITKDVDSWELMWDEEYAGKILNFDNPRDAFGIAQILLGIDPNSNKLEDIEKAGEKLAEQKPLIQSYVMDQVYGQMQDEEAWIAAYYAGDYLLMSQENENLEFVYPKEGFNLFIDVMCIPKDAENKEAAEAYINFLTDPEIAGQNLDYIGYSAPMSAAKEYMDEEMANSDIAYPSDEVLSRGVVYENLTEETTKRMNELFNDIKASGSGWSAFVFAGIGVAAVALVVYLIVRKKKREDY